MCHIGRDGEENEMRMHRSISPKGLEWFRSRVAEAALLSTRMAGHHPWQKKKNNK